MAVLAVLSLTVGSLSQAQTAASRAEWLKDARLGVFMHVLPVGGEDLAKLERFDAEGLAAQIASTGARYLVVTLGQNSGYFNAPNAAYDRITGYRPGERCATRDLPRDLHRALQAKGLRLMLYLPCQAPNQDRRAQKAFGLAEGPKDQPIDARFARQWAEVIAEWSTRYADAVSGWWFDGGYESVRFSEEIAGLYAEAARRGNPASIVTFNPGVSLKRHTRAEDYTAGELNEPFGFVPTSRFVDGSQWHALTFVGSHWGARDTRFPAEQWREWFGKVVAGGGAVTLDVGPNWDEKAGPIGSIAAAQLAQLRAVGRP
ncbi:MAG: alpha-L-fucosidase [Vicinamibacteria bacterium]